MSVPVNIYAENPTSRHHFVFQLVFNELLGIDYTISGLETCHINYSNTSDNGIACTPHGLLNELIIRTDILEEISFSRWNNIPCFFKTSEHALPFDLFSAIFFLVSRYEEYIVQERDEHNRFEAISSVLFKNNVLQEPLVNRWALELQKMLKEAYPELHFKPRNYSFISTIDVDQTWKFRQKGLFRAMGASVSDILERKWENFLLRWPVILRLKKDPFFNFDWQENIHKSKGVEVIYFWLLSKRGKFDKNVSPSNRKQAELIQHLDRQENTTIGIHPSYASQSQKTAVSAEITTLKSILNRKITKSRQHFLLHQMPKTYKNLVQLKIEEDYTMGYSTHFGFRAGIAAPFNFFDLVENKTTNLRLFPFCTMDITPLHYMHKSPNEATEEITILLNKVKSVGGLFISLWHNESLSETERWKGWRIVYERMITEASN